ncbi:MAG: LuxR C-terminal-related transcriptional regulator [Sphingomicrobium sp.]
MSAVDDPLLALIGASPVASVVTNPRLADNPIVAANSAFTDLTGYPASEIIGRNCRFLAGDRTEPWITEQIRVGIRDRRTVLVDILNYRRDGSTFRNGVMITPLFGDQGELAYFLGSQVDLGSDAPALFSSRRAHAADLISALPKRQREVLSCVSKGLLNKQIAHMLGISEKTVKMHRALLLERLNVRTSAEAIRLAVEAGL